MLTFGANIKNTLVRVKTKPRISKQKAISEIVKGLRKGLATEDIISGIVSKSQITERTLYRHLKEAKAIHFKEQQEIERLAREQILEAKKEELKSEILSIQQRKEFLTKLITAKTRVTQFGKATIETLENDDGRLEVITNDIKIRALQELNKMDGAYAPTKSEVLSNMTISTPKTLADWYNQNRGNYNSDKADD